MRLFCTPKRLQLFTCIIGAISVFSVLIILFLENWPAFAKKKLLEQIIFKNGSMEFDRFQTTADLVNLRLEIFVYNVTNPEDVVNNSAKINIQQLGPFVYHEYKAKEILDNNQTSGLITYKLRKRYTFKPELSVGDPKKLKINWINVPLVATKPIIDKMSLADRYVAMLFFKSLILILKEPAFISDTIDNLVFSGSKRNLYKQIQKLDVFKSLNPWPLPDNKFAVLYNKNNTWLPGRDYVFTMSAGFGENQTHKDLNQYIFMNGSKTLPFWRSQPPNCNKLSGTDGEFFSPFLNKSQTLEAYSSDICRKLPLKYRKTAYIDGVSVYKYTLDERSLQSSVKNPENDCYCLTRNSNDQPLRECYIDGLIDLSTCITPNVIGSGAHFLYGSPELRDRITGLPKVNVSCDEPSAHVEPNTGLTIRVKVPLQLNIRLESGGFRPFNWFKDSQPLIVPLMYVVEAAEMTSDQASQLRNKLLVLDSWLVSMVLGGTIIFILAIVASAIVVCLKFQRPRHSEASEQDPLIPASNETNSEVVHQDRNEPGSTYRTI